MTEKHLQNDLVCRKTLEALGVEKSDCSFNLLKRCASSLPAERADVSNQWHYDLIGRLVKKGDSIIDLGCGDGELLARLAYSCKCWIQGVEKDEALVNRCIERGVPVCHADLADILYVLPDNSYTWAVLEDTIFSLQKPLEAIETSLRIARRSIITFPNFAHWSVRFTFSLGGRMPVTKSLPYTWYNTPNIHLCSITDFLDWVSEAGVHICQAWVLVDGEVRPFHAEEQHNVTAEKAFFVIERGRSGKKRARAGQAKEG